MVNNTVVGLTIDNEVRSNNPGPLTRRPRNAHPLSFFAAQSSTKYIKSVRVAFGCGLRQPNVQATDAFDEISFSGGPPTIFDFERN